MREATRLARVAPPLALLAACATAAPRVSSAAAPASFVAVDAAALTVTSGAVTRASDGGLALRAPAVRAIAEGRPRGGAELAFVYRGPSRETAPLASGEARRQIGLKLRAHDTCNVVYVMWHIEPTAGIHVSLKVNPGATTHAACGDRGYVSLTPRWSRALAPVRVGERRTLRATIVGGVVHVAADGLDVWTGPLPAEARALDGPVGLRSDNGEFDVVFRAEAP